MNKYEKKFFSSKNCKNECPKINGPLLKGEVKSLADIRGHYFCIYETGPWRGESSFVNLIWEVSNYEI